MSLVNRLKRKILVLGYFVFGLGSSNNDSSYGAPSASYEAPSTSYHAPDSSYQAPSSGYSAPSSGYSPPSHFVSAKEDQV